MGCQGMSGGRRMMTAKSHQDLTASTHGLVGAIKTSKRALEKFALKNDFLRMVHFSKKVNVLDPTFLTQSFKLSQAGVVGGVNAYI